MGLLRLVQFTWAKQGNVMCKNTPSMPPWLKFSPRWRPPPSRQIRKWWRASGSILYSTIWVLNTIYHQVAIFFLPNYCNLHEVSFVERFLDHLSFGLPSLCPCIRLFHWRSDHTGFHKPVRSKRKTNHASYVTKTKTNTTQVIKTLLNNFKLCLRLKYIFPHSVRFLSCKHHILFH